MSSSVEGWNGQYLGYQCVSASGLPLNSFSPMSGKGLTMDPQSMRGILLCDSESCGYNGRKSDHSANEIFFHDNLMNLSQGIDMHSTSITQPQMGFIVPGRVNDSGAPRGSPGIPNFKISKNAIPIGKDNDGYQFVPVMAKGGSSEGNLGIRTSPVIFVTQTAADTSNYLTNYGNGQIFYGGSPHPPGVSLKHMDTLGNGRTNERTVARASEYSHKREVCSSSPHIMEISSSPFRRRTGSKYSGVSPNPGYKPYAGPQAWVNRGDGWKCLDLEVQV